MQRVLSWIAGNFGRKCKSTTSSLPGRRRLRLESLEARQLMAIDVYYDDGYRDGDFVAPDQIGLHIIGTNGPDEVYVTEKNGAIVVKSIDPERNLRYDYAWAYMTPNIFFDGLKGDDKFISESFAKVYARGNEGHDTLDCRAASYVELIGGKGNDILYGGPNGDILRGNDGDDQLIGAGGENFLYGNGGNDLLVGGDENDLLDGGIGDDDLFGHGGDDTLTGGPNENYGTDEDVMVGGRGVDYLYGGFGRDSLNGNDPFEGVSDGSYDYLDGQLGADILFNPLVTNGSGRWVREDEVANFSANQGDLLKTPLADKILEIIPGTSFTEQRAALLAGLSQGMSLTTEEPLGDFYDEAIAEGTNLTAAYDQALLEMLEENNPGVLGESEFSGDSLEWIEEPTTEEAPSAETTDDLQILSSPATSWTQTFTNPFIARIW